MPVAKMKFLKIKVKIQKRKMFLFLVSGIKNTMIFAKRVKIAIKKLKLYKKLLKRMMQKHRNIDTSSLISSWKRFLTLP